MIDWLALGANGLWLLGLALILAGGSAYAYAGTRARQPFRQVWPHFARNTWVRGGLVLVCAGLAATSTLGLEGAGWGGLGLYIVVVGIRDRRRIRESFPLGGVARALPQPADSGARLVRIAEVLVRAELLWLALLAPFFLFPAPTRLWPLLGLPLLWIVRRLARGHFIPRTPLDWPIALLLSMVLVSLYATADLAFSLEKITGVLFGIGVYYAVVDWTTTRTRRAWAQGLYVCGGAALAVIGLLGTQWVNKWPPLARLAAALPSIAHSLPGAANGISPNEIGGALLWVVPCQLVLGIMLWQTWPARPVPRWGARLGTLILLLVSGGMLVLTQSRSAFLGLACALVLLCWLGGRWTRAGLGVLLGLGLVVLIIGGSAANISQALTTLYAGADSAGGALTFDGRLEIWSRAIYGIEDFPFTGMGMNMFRRLLPVLYPLQSASPTQDLAHAHNHFLQVALDLGLPGLVAYLALWILAGALLVQIWRTIASRDLRGLAAGLGASLLAYFVYGITDTVALGAKPGVVFWALLALIVVGWREAIVRPLGPLVEDSAAIRPAAALPAAAASGAATADPVPELVKAGSR